ncbi:MAG TPA: hypothetical protein VJV79_05005 [Polyangiaceae bacterium]|nr:hypothetical protein [Polyangiaceae bacterium]
MMLIAQSCIVADPPEYRAPIQTRPVPNVYSAAPTTTKVLVVFRDNSTIRFNVPIQSEDAGEALRALFFLDYGTLDQRKLQGQTISASTFDNTGRAATLDWIPMQVSAGCHFVTLVVAHGSSFQSNNDDLLDPSKADEDASLVTWTVNMYPTDDLNTLPNCPSSVAPGATP